MTKVISYVLTNVKGGMCVDLEEGLIPIKTVNGSEMPSSHFACKQVDFETASDEDDIDVFELLKNNESKTPVWKIHLYMSGNGKKCTMKRKDLISVGKRI